ncbi:MAG TPA: DUF2877 domain-containing protein [Hyphomicrobiaceae bacterium]|nr:DUF2877 domain-containing protein [Hyphomicrobiaceae bacterium]
MAGFGAAPRDAVRRLLGLGPGLTPSGDDILAGMLIALHASGRANVATELAAIIASMPSELTSVISWAHLDAAAEGLPGPAIHRALIAILAGDHAALSGVLDVIDTVGHCSGWDMLAGAVVALAAVAGDG